HEWPINNSPTPYDIFGLNNNTNFINNTELKKKYLKLCKIYHPDLSKRRVILDSKGIEISNKIKEERFKKIISSYKILKDTRSRNLYDRYKIGWENNNNAFNNQNIYRYNNFSDQKYWSAGTWQDYQNIRTDSVSIEDLNRRHLLYAFVSLFLCLVVLEIFNVISTVEDDLMKSYRKSEEIEVNLFKSYNNYGFGLDKFSRIQRFLWWRRFSLFFEGNQERIKKSIEDDEKLMKKLVESSKARNE
ncbi:uncharacterized protein ASCRUDRAFT_17161, partial [Ascoidea rubescens DSM 1968]